MNQPDPMQWHRDERDSLVRQIKGLASGQVRSRQRIDGELTDTAAPALENLRTRLAKLERFLGNADAR